MVSPVYHICCRYAVDSARVLCIDLESSVLIILKCVICCIDIKSSVVNHPTRISAETLSCHRVILAVFLPAAVYRNRLKEFIHSFCINILLSLWEFSYTIEEEILKKNNVSDLKLTASVNVCVLLNKCICNAACNVLSCSSKVKYVNTAVTVYITENSLTNNRLASAGDNCTFNCTNNFVNVEVIVCFSVIFSSLNVDCCACSALRDSIACI